MCAASLRSRDQRILVCLHGANGKGRYIAWTGLIAERCAFSRVPWVAVPKVATSAGLKNRVRAYDALLVDGEWFWLVSSDESNFVILEGVCSGYLA